MAVLSGALVDRARVVRKVETGERVEGRSLLVPTHGEWFPARLIVSPSREVADDRAGVRRIVERGELVCSTEDVLASDELDVKSRTFGDGRWRVAGTAQVTPTRRPGRAVVVPVERLVEPPPQETTD